MRAISVRRPLLAANALESVILRHPELVYRSLNIALSRGKHAALMHFEGTPKALRTLREEYVDDAPPYIEQIQVVQESPRAMILYKTERSGKGPVEIAGLVHGAFGSECLARVRKDVSGAQWDILTFRDDAVNKFLQTLRARGVFTEVASRRVTAWQLSKFSQARWSIGDEILTAQEEKALRHAVKLGYFDHPRRAEVREVAKALRVPASTAHYHLRRGTAKLVKDAVDGH